MSIIAHKLFSVGTNSGSSKVFLQNVQFNCVLFCQLSDSSHSSIKAAPSDGPKKNSPDVLALKELKGSSVGG